MKTYVTPPPQNLMPVTFLLLLSLLLTACSSAPGSVLESFYQAIAEGDNEDALAHVSFATASASNMRRTQYRTEIAINAIARHLKDNGGLEQTRVLEAGNAEAGNIRRVRLLLTFANGGQETTPQIALIARNGRWKLMESAVPLAAFGREIEAVLSAYFEALLSGSTDVDTGVLSIRHNHLLRVARNRQLISQSSASGGLKMVEVTAFDYFDERLDSVPQVVTYTLVFHHGDPYTGTESLVLEQGIWKMY